MGLPEHAVVRRARHLRLSRPALARLHAKHDPLALAETGESSAQVIDHAVAVRERLGGLELVVDRRPGVLCAMIAERQRASGTPAHVIDGLVARDHRDPRTDHLERLWLVSGRMGEQRDDHVVPHILAVGPIDTTACALGIDRAPDARGNVIALGACDDRDRRLAQREQSGCHSRPGSRENARPGKCSSRRAPRPPPWLDTLSPMQQARIAIIGAGYVGLPLGVAFAEIGDRVTFIEPEQLKVDRINAGDSYIKDIPSEQLTELVTAGLVSASSDYATLADCDDVVICVPTPLNENREPDLSFIVDATERIAPHLRAGHLVVLESTTFPGTTREIMKPILERSSGLVAGVDFNLAMSPERIDPGRTDYTVRTMPKVVGGLTPACTERATALYGRAIDTLVAVSSTEAAELAKLLENIFRSVNIALMNEMAMLCDRMGIDIWEVAEAAGTKPFGFMPFKPGPGLGGHCIPLDPFYLSWKAREYDFHTEFIELAGKVNQNMPYFCREKITRALNGRATALRTSRLLVIGVAYKPNIDDTRESPALKLIELLREEGALVSYHDPFVAQLPEFELESVPLEAVESYDAVVIVTNHAGIDYDLLREEAELVIDLRNATGVAGTHDPKVVKL